jgi:PadR family transcriptional regulator
MLSATRAPSDRRHPGGEDATSGQTAMTTPENMVRDFFLGFIEVHILHHAAQEPVYGLALISELRRHGYELSPGKMYPVLHELE